MADVLWFKLKRPVVYAAVRDRSGFMGGCFDAMRNDGASVSLLQNYSGLMAVLCS